MIVSIHQRLISVAWLSSSVALVTDFFWTPFSFEGSFQNDKIKTDRAGWVSVPVNNKGHMAGLKLKI